MFRAVIPQRIEGLIIFVTGLILFWQWHGTMPVWVAVLAYLVPDISIATYLLGPKVGGFCYNLVHLYSFGMILLGVGLIMPMPLLAALGALWMAHAGMDRLLTFGLKTPGGFAFTHLGDITFLQRHRG